MANPQEKSMMKAIEMSVKPLVQTVSQQRLFGRKYQAIALREAYQRICCSFSGEGRKAELVLITGVSGTGKTTLANDLKQFVTSHKDCRGLFIKGKYDHLHRQNQAPFGAFVSAFTDYANQILEEGGDVVHDIRERVRGNKHVDRNLLVNMVPRLEDLLGEATEESITASSEDGRIILSDSQRHGFRLTFSEFIGVVSAYRPVVVFLDDLQWCDRDSLELLENLAFRAHAGFMILGACRGNEVAVNDPLSECLRLIEHSGVVVTDIRLTCLDELMVHELISLSLHLEKAECAELASVVFRQTGGNFFYLTHFLNALQLDMVLYYEDTEGRWRWDGEKLQVLQSSSVELMRKMMRRLPEDAQTVLKTAASIGAQFRASILGLLLPSIDVHSALETASMVAFVVAEPIFGVYSFTHDQIQEAAYTLIPDDERSGFHWNLCRMLWKNTDSTADELYLSLVVGQITKSVFEIKAGRDRKKAGLFLLKAGRKASSSSAFGTALAYLQLGIDLLGKKRWHEHYDLCLSLHNVAAEVAYGAGDSVRLDGLTNSVFLYAKSYEDKVSAYSIKILSLGSAHQLQEAMELGLEVLKEVGEPIGKPSKVGALIGMLQVGRELRKLSSEDILNLPQMTDPKKLMAMRVMSLLFLYSLFGRPEYTMPLATRSIRLTLRHGQSAMSVGGFSAWAIVLASKIPLIGDIDEAYNLAKLSLEMLDKLGHARKQWLPRVYVSAYGMVFPWREPIENCRGPLWHAYRVGMRTGDVEFGMMAAMMHVFNVVFWGTPLHVAHREIAELRKTAQAFHIDLVDAFLAPTQQFIANMAGESEDVFTLTGEFMNEREERRAASIRVNFAARMNIPLLKGWLGLYMGNWELAEKSHQEFANVDEAFRSSLARCAYYFQAAMTAVALLRKYGRNRKRYRTFKRCFREIRKMAQNCPANFYMLQTMLEAEKSAFEGKIDDSVNRYKLAIELSQKEKSKSYEAIAADRLARTLDSDKRRWDEARENYIKARSVFEAWGVNVKVDQLNDIIAMRDDFDASLQL